MTVLQAVVLGMIQGLTEFLPVSSSGHLVLGQHLFGLREPVLFFDISVHVGTLAAVMIFFRKEIVAVLAALIRVLSARSPLKDEPDARLAVLIAAGSVPTAAIGLMFREIADRLFSSVFLVGVSLIVTGLLLWATRTSREKCDGEDHFTVGRALIIGTVQGIAILPGISRSGSTIAAGLFLGLKREVAARYSFLLSIPAIVGAEILSLKDAAGSAVMDMQVLTGALTAGVVGYASLAMLVYVVNRGRMHYFAPYCWTVGVVALVISLFSEGGI